MVSQPLEKNRPVMPSTVVADMKSPEMAKPFWAPLIVPPAL